MTAIGIQDGQTLKKEPGMTEYLMKGEMDMETAIKDVVPQGLDCRFLVLRFR